MSLTLNTVSALFLGGADPKLPEIRSAPFRGVLRFWLRAALANQHIEMTELRKAEINVFGGIVRSSNDDESDYGGASPILMTVSAANQDAIQTAERFLLPHRTSESKSAMSAIIEDTRFQLILNPRLGFASLPDECVQMLLLFLHLGGIGKRSRRAFGSLQLEHIKGSESIVSDQLRHLLNVSTTIADGEALAQHIKLILAPFTQNPSRTHAPDHPVLDPRFAKVVVCKRPFPTEGSDHPYAQPLIDFWELLRNDDYRDAPIFGYAHGNSRLASPIIFHLSLIGSNLHLVITAFKTQIAGASWQLAQQFLDEFISGWWQGEQVFGQADKWADGEYHA